MSGYRTHSCGELTLKNINEQLFYAAGATHTRHERNDIS